jgi:hypothetical protein
MRLSWLQAAVSLFLAAMLSAPAWATNTGANSALPGTLNYVEGRAFVGSQSLDGKSIGQVTLEAGQSLDTEKGKAEMLLTPGVFLREGDNTSVKLVSAGLADTELVLVQGHAMVEATEVLPQNNLRIVEDGITTRILKPGLYDFDGAANQVRVFDGEAAVLEADKEVKVKAGHEVTLAAAAPEKAQKFDRKAYDNDDLYRWSSLRSAYVAEANVDAARYVVADGGGWYGPGWYGPGWWGFGGWGPGWGGWYWDPWFSAYTFIPGGGLFYSPFGWGFYSPGLVWRAPFVGGHFYHTFNAANVAAWGRGPHYVSGANGHFTSVAGAHGAFHAGPVGGMSAAHGGAASAGRMGGGMGGGFSHGGGGGRR